MAIALQIIIGGKDMKNEIKKLEHSTYRCQYHIVFAPKYSRKVIYGEIKADIGQILRKLCQEKKVEIIEAEACPDHIHMLVSIPHLYFFSFAIPPSIKYNKKECTFVNLHMHIFVHI